MGRVTDINKTFKELVIGFRSSDPDITKWWIEKIDSISDEIIVPFVDLSMDREDLKQEVFVTIYEKLSSEDYIHSLYELLKFVKNRLIDVISSLYGYTTTQLKDWLSGYNKTKRKTKIKPVYKSVDIDSLSNRLSYQHNYKTYKVPLNVTLDEILATITPKEEKVIRMKNGIGCEVANRIVIGNEFRVTAMRITQIDHDAMRKLRHPSRSIKLLPYL